MFRGDPAHSGGFDEAVPAPAGAPVWKFQAGASVVSTPAVVGGALFVGADDGKLYALDASTGKLRWSFKTLGAIRSSPAVGGGLVVFVSRDGSAYGVDATTGVERWKFTTGGERWYEARGLNFMSPKSQTVPEVWDLYLSSPAIVRDRVYFGSGDGFVYALDLARGTEVWKYKTGDVVHASPAVAGGRVLVGSFDSWFYALDAATGKELWRFKTGSADLNHTGVQSSAAVAGDTVVFGCRDGRVYALDTATGALRWQADHAGTWVNASPAIVGGKVYYGTSIPSRIIARDAATGAQVFSRDEKAMVFASATVGQDALLVASFAGTVTARALGDGAARWELRSDASVRNERKLLKPDGALDPQAVFGGAPIAEAFWFEHSFVVMERLFSVGAVPSSPVVAGGLVYFAATDGGVYAFGAMPAKTAAR
jgi:outer membrane protein assembly factor BamB